MPSNSCGDGGGQVGDTELFVFRGLLIAATVLWLVATWFSTRRFVEALYAARELGVRVPFVSVSAAFGLSHLAVALIYAAVTYWQQMWLVRVALYAIPTSTMLWALFFIYLGWATSRRVAK